MNLNLLQQNFTQNYPDEFDGILDSSNAVVLTVAFNRRGTLLAGGCNDGKILIWDFTTRGLSRVILGHSHPVSSLDWTRNGFYLCSSGADNYINIWRVTTGECVYSFRSTLPVLTAKFCPRYYSRRFFKCKKPVGRSENLRNSEQLYHLLVQPLQTPPRIIDTELVVHKNSILTKNCIIELSQAVDENDVNFCVSWNRRGDKVYVGNGKGRIFVFRWEEIIQMKSSKTVESIWDFKIFSTFKITSPASVRLIEFSKKGSKFVVVTDKVIRMYQEDLIKDNKPDSPNAKSNKQSNRISSKEYSKEMGKENGYSWKELVPIHSLKDQINRQSWRVCCFSGEGEYICAGQVKQNNLNFYETESDSAGLVKSLTTRGGDTFTDVVWHPHRPIICTLCSGQVSVYTHNYIENWSAFAPDFEELEENRIYMEREDEFDDSDEDKSVKDDVSVCSDLNLDICGDEQSKVAAYCSSDEEVAAEFLEYLPLSIDQIEQGTQQNQANLLAGNLLGKNGVKMGVGHDKVKTAVGMSSLGVQDKRSAGQREAAQQAVQRYLESERVSENANNSENSKNGENSTNCENGENDKNEAEKSKTDEKLRTDDKNKVRIASEPISSNTPIEFDFGSQRDNLIHPLLIPGMKAVRAAKRKQEKLDEKRKMESVGKETGGTTGKGGGRGKRTRARD